MEEKVREWSLVLNTLGIFNCMFPPPNNEFFLLCLQINLSGTISGPLTDQKLQIIISCQLNSKDRVKHKHLEQQAENQLWIGFWERCIESVNYSPTEEFSFTLHKDQAAHDALAIRTPSCTLFNYSCRIALSCGFLVSQLNEIRDLTASLQIGDWRLFAMISSAETFQWLQYFQDFGLWYNWWDLAGGFSHLSGWDVAMSGFLGGIWEFSILMPLQKRRPTATGSTKGWRRMPHP